MPINPNHSSAFGRRIKGLILLAATSIGVAGVVSIEPVKEASYSAVTIETAQPLPTAPALGQVALAELIPTPTVTAAPVPKMPTKPPETTTTKPTKPKAAPAAPVPQASPAESTAYTNMYPLDADFETLAGCEAPNGWNTNTGNGYFGGLQFDDQTWKANGGLRYAPRADLATKQQQIEIGRRTYWSLGANGKPRRWSPWPTCSVRFSLPVYNN